MQSESVNVKSVVQVMHDYGKCISLIPMDPHFEDMSVALYLKNKTFTVWTFHRAEGYQERLIQITEQLVSLTDMKSMKDSPNQLTFPDEIIPVSPLKFAFRLAVEKPYGFSLNKGRIEVRDTKSPLTIIATPEKTDDGWKYTISSEGEYKNTPMRIRAVIRGLSKFGSLEEIDNISACFPSRKRHDKLVRLILPYAKNISAVEDQLESDNMRGQLTTQTLGFSQV